jgi:hypothetical protein
LEIHSLSRPVTWDAFVRQHHAIFYPLMLFICWRMATAVLAIASVNFVPAETPVVIYEDAAGQVYHQALPPDSPLAAIVEPWHRFDTGWYIKNAITGYQQDQGIVFPLFYPLLIQLTVTVTTGNYVLAALIVSNTAGAISFILLYRLILREFEDIQLAQRTLLLLAGFPTAFFMHSGYSESLYLALVLGAFLAALDRRWWLAGLLAALSALTRVQGVIMLFPLAWIAYVRLREPGWRALLLRIPAAVGGPVGLGVHFAFLRLNNLGDMQANYSAGWGSSVSFPGESILVYFNRLVNGQAVSYETSNFVLLMFFIGLSLMVLRRFRFEYALYMGATLGMLLALKFENEQFVSTFRHLTMFFPCFILLAMHLKSPRAMFALLTVTFGWQFLLIFFYTHWIWVA